MSNRLLEPTDDGYNAVYDTRHGRIAGHIRDEYITASLEAYGEYSEVSADLCRQMCQPGSVVIDVGANVGALTLALAKSIGPTGHIYAFEPALTTFLQLCATLALNDILNTSATRAIVGNETGATNIANPKVDAEHIVNFAAFTKRHWEGLPQQLRHLRTPKIRLDEYLQNPSPHLLRVDVGGMEKEVLQGADNIIRSGRPMLYVANNVAEHSQALIEHIQALNYKAFWHPTMLFNPDNHLQNPENFMIADSGAHLATINVLAIPEEVQIGVQGFTEIDDPSAYLGDI